MSGMGADMDDCCDTFTQFGEDQTSQCGVAQLAGMVTQLAWQVSCLSWMAVHGAAQPTWAYLAVVGVYRGAGRVEP